jgi:hypothetical protein
LSNVELIDRRFVVAALAVLVAVSCRSPSKPPAAHAQTPQVVTWQKLGSWSGHGSLQTESFTSDTGSLRVQWETRRATDPQRGTFRLTFHSAISGRPLAEAVDQHGAGRDIAYVPADPHVFYAVVDSADLDWTFTVEEGIVGGS